MGGERPQQVRTPQRGKRRPRLADQQHRRVAERVALLVELEAARRKRLRRLSQESEHLVGRGAQDLEARKDPVQIRREGLSNPERHLASGDEHLQKMGVCDKWDGMVYGKWEEWMVTGGGGERV